jgi:hypothetical protein
MGKHPVESQLDEVNHLLAGIPTVRVHSIDQDYEMNPQSVASGLKQWPKEEAITLVEHKIADGSYRDWRYEIRPEISLAEATPAPAAAPSESPAFRLCANLRCRKGPNSEFGSIRGPSGPVRSDATA